MWVVTVSIITHCIFSAPSFKEKKGKKKEGRKRRKEGSEGAFLTRCHPEISGRTLRGACLQKLQADLSQEALWKVGISCVEMEGWSV